jgi:SPP1 gp7 family putative phage head morphogenesis protein
MPSELEEAALRFRSQLLRQERAAASEMVQGYAAAWQRTRARLAELQEQIDAARRDGLIPGPFTPRQPGGPVIEQAPGTFSLSWLYERDRLTTLLRHIEAELRQFGALAGELTEAGQMQAVRAAQTNAEALVNTALRGAQGPEVVGMFNRLSREAVQDLVGFASDGSPLRELFEALGPRVSRGVQDALVTAVATGIGPRETTRLVRREFGMGLARALTIARTEQIRAYREASRRSYAENADLLDGWVWLSARDSRTCVSCWAMHGSRHPVTETLDDHPNGRCTMVPIVKGHDPNIATGEDLFMELPPAQQQKIMGKAAHLAYQGGAVRLSDFAGQRDDPRWGTMRYAKSLREVVGRQEADRWIGQVQQRARWQPITDKIGKLTDRKAVLPLGQLPTQPYRAMREQWPTSVTPSVVLTGERRAHYLKSHPEMRSLESELLAALFDPNEIHLNKQDPQISIWYRRLNTGQYLRVVVWVSDTQGLQNSVHSFRLADEKEVNRGRKRKRLLWKK